jgi:hypothetical protein
MKNILLLFCIAFGLSACTDDCCTPPTWFYKSYIQTFVDCRFLHNRQLNVQAGIRMDGGIQLDIYGRVSSGEDAYRDSSVFYDNTYYNSLHLDEEGRIYYARCKQGYDKYIAIVGDTSYNAELDMPLDVRAMITPLHSIAITADKDFGDDYPAGSDLSSLFTVCFDDPYATVKNGYKSIEGTGSLSHIVWYPQSVVSVKLSEANFSERPFIGDEWLCLLDLAPEQTGEYTFYVKARLVDGTVLEGTASPITIKGRTE